MTEAATEAETECALVIDGTEVPYAKLTFDMPRHAHPQIEVPGDTGTRCVLGRSGFGISFCGLAEEVGPYLDGEPHDIVLRAAEAGVELPVHGIRLTKYADHDGLAYGYGVAADEDHQVATWKELVPNG